MIKENLYFGEEGREGLARGIMKCRDAVGGTMGTAGSNAILEALESPGHMTTNDGATILQSIYLEDPIEQMGRNILLEAVSRANKQSGDGSSTTCVLTAAIIEEGQKILGEKSPMEVKRSLEDCIPLIEESINNQKREITIDEVGQVASISAEDKEIGARIQEIYEQIGKDGIIQWDISKTAEDSYSIGTGITIEGAGVISPYMCDADEKGQNTNRIKLKNPTVLLTKQKIASASEFNEIGFALNSKEIRDVVVFCDEYEPLMVNDLILTRAKKGFRFILIKMPVLWKDQWYEDLSLASGARIVDPALGFALKDVKPEHLGRFDHIHITKDETFIDGIQDLTDHIAKLKEGTDDDKVRAARLNTRTARYFVGAHSDSALSYRRLKVEDAISAAWQALHGGIVIGGGHALLKCAKRIDNKILKEALKAPYYQISDNMGKDFSEKDMEDQQVYDPANVVLNAAKNAISVAASILTASTVITLPREETPQVQPNALIR